MERRDFIVRSALATGAMALANHITLASNAGLDSICSSTLSQSSPQVRHGLFQLRALTNLSFPKWLNVYEK
ncbi:MAG: twin-arginine translocation signal domain-containing protein, partial [Bacteroidetes bacterium]|nr:twin-arginine translocation signal domain-containing protein [Bacteroidota bacterium]